MFDLGEREDLGRGGGHRVGVAGVQQALEHHPAVVHVAVDRQVDPAEAAVRDAALHLVLPADEVAARQLGNERVSRAALGAEALGAPGLSVAAASDGLAAVGVAAEPAAPPAPSGRSGSRRPGRPSECAASRRPRRRGGRDCWPIVDDPVRAVRTDAVRADGVADGARRRRGRDGLRCGGCIGCGRGAADVAVAVDDGPAAARFGARHSVFPRFSTSSCW